MIVQKAIGEWKRIYQVYIAIRAIYPNPVERNFTLQLKRHF